ncbi:MAG: DUF790 family protein [Proteobacteria bacterium]|nr:DUF790 family protein [Pseudomonadota bacterium]
MLPKNLLQYHLVGNNIVPHYLTERDHPWLREVVEAFRHLVDQPVRAWEERKAAGWSVCGPEGKRQMAIGVLERLAKMRPMDGPIRPKQARQVVFAAAEHHRADVHGRAKAMQEAAGQLSVSVAQLEQILFADLAAQRILTLDDELPDCSTLAERVNLALVQGLLNRSLHVDIRLRGNARAVVRQVHLRRLIAVARPLGPDAVSLEVSGVYSLFRRTTVYGRSLASILPVLGWCDDFALQAQIALGKREGTLTVGPDAPIGRGRTPTKYDSKLEARFARDFARQFPDWVLVREPLPLEVDGTLVFPDFELSHRTDNQRFLVEIVGFWTADYLTQKVGRLSRAGRSDIVLVVDEARCAAAAELAPQLTVVPFKRSIKPSEVMAAFRSMVPRKTKVVHRSILLRDLFVDFAGRHSPTDSIHDRLAMLQPQQEVVLERRQNRVLVVDSSGPVAALSRAACVRHADIIDGNIVVRVTRKTHRQAEQSAPRYRGLLQCSQWWVPELEIVATSQC